MARTRSQTFTSRQRAEIFARDRAMCCFTGKNLWLLDYGASPSSGAEIDHIDPAAKGGAADLDNAATAIWLYNQAKRDSRSGVYLFYAGWPTETFFTLFETVPSRIADHIKRFRALHWTDAYFNRAVGQTLLAAAQETEKIRADGNPWTRGLEYRSRLALKNLNQWRQYVEKEQPGDLKSRGLLPDKPSVDQKLVMRLFDAETPADIEQIVITITPFSAASWQAFVDLAKANTAQEAKKLLRHVKADQYVTERVKKAVGVNVERLWG